MATLLVAGNDVEVAGRAIGIDADTLRAWLDPDALERDYAAFRAGVERALAEGEARHVAHIDRAAVDDWRAAAWLLERSHPDRWGKPGGRTQPVQAAPAADPLDAIDGDIAALNQ